MNVDQIIAALATQLPSAMRWAGAVARRMRHYDIALAGKNTGSAGTDALTLADLTVQELLVGALRDGDPRFRQCRIDAEESTGDLARFASVGDLTLALDPIDGTRHYRDKTGNGYSIILTLRNPQTVVYTLVFIPESGPHGTWVEIQQNQIVCGPDDPSRPAQEVLGSLPVCPHHTRATAQNIFVIGFQQHDRTKADLVSQTGLVGIPGEECTGCLYELLARGEYAGSLIRTPNVYDFPAALQLARASGGESLWVHNEQPVNFQELWTDDRAHMLRLPGIVATSADRDVLRTLCALARDWNPVRYGE
ncbi:MAG: inositol monophosphatase [Planctomycetes bacterium]|nr:inositol monophosphatase [Planctomycetota bacterium]